MRKFLANIGSLLAGNLFQQMIGFVFSLIMLQKLSTGDFALQSAIVAFTSIVMGIADLGLFDVATRELAVVSGKQQQKAYNSLFSLELILSSTVCLAAAFIAWLLHSFPGDQFFIFLLAIFALVLSYAPIIPTEALMAARGRVGQIALIQSFYALSTCVLGALILILGGGIGPIYLALFVLSVLTILLYFREVWHLLPGGLRLVFEPKQWLHYLSQSIPSGIGVTLQMACLRLGTYLTYTLAAQESTAYLGVSYFLVVGVTSLVWVPFAVNIMPVIARLYTQSRDHLVWLGGRSLILLLSVTLPIAVGTSLLAPEILAVLGEKQIAAAPTLRIYIWTLPLAVSAAFLYRLLLVMRQPKTYMFITLGGAILSTALCLPLIPLYGGVGAALAAVIGMILIAVFEGWTLRRWLLPHIHVADVPRLLLALAAMIGVVQISEGWSIFIRIGAAGSVYGVILIALQLFSSNDRRLAHTVLAVTQNNDPTHVGL